MPTESIVNRCYIGAHLSVANGMAKMIQQAVDMQATTCQFFSRNPRGTSSKKVDLQDVSRAHQLMALNRFGPLIAHAPYIVNLAASKVDTWELGIRIMAEDLEKITALGVNYLVVHPGSRTIMTMEDGIQRIAVALEQILQLVPHGMILLETMAGMGSEVGGEFQNIAQIIASVSEPQRLGVCLDTCHMFAAGYAVHSDFGQVLDDFDRIIGLDRVKAIHLNDSLLPFGSRKDRHANLGEGQIGWDAIYKIISEPRLLGIPINLETPGGDENYRKEIAMIHEFWKDTPCHPL
jgi:deoxyribonuclease-4